MKFWSSRAWLWLSLVAVASSHATSNQPVATVPIEMRGNRVWVPAHVNGEGPFLFLLDTGFSITTVHPEMAEKLELRRAGQIRIIGIAGEESSPMFEGAAFTIGEARYAPRRVAAIPSERERRRRRDGILGAGLFRQYVVELDAAGNTMKLYAPSNFVYAGKGETIPLTFRRSSTPIIAATIHGVTNAPVQGEFEIDTGCDSAVCVGSEFAKQHGLLDAVETKSGSKVGVGGDAETRDGHLPELRLGALKVMKPQTDFFLNGSPAGPGLAGHIGFASLRQFKVIFDYSRQRMILEPR